MMILARNTIYCDIDNESAEEEHCDIDNDRNNEDDKMTADADQSIWPAKGAVDKVRVVGRVVDGGEEASRHVQL